MQLSPTEQPRVPASLRILADLDRRIAQYDIAVERAVTHGSRMLLTGWRDALADVRAELAYRLGVVEQEAVAPSVEPTATSFAEWSATAGRA